MKQIFRIMISLWKVVRRDNLNKQLNSSSHLQIQIQKIKEYISKVAMMDCRIMNNKKK
jgi:hypothetical protein